MPMIKSLQILTVLCSWYNMNYWSLYIHTTIFLMLVSYVIKWQILYWTYWANSCYHHLDITLMIILYFVLLCPMDNILFNIESGFTMMAGNVSVIQYELLVTTYPYHYFIGVGIICYKNGNYCTVHIELILATTILISCDTLMIIL